MRLTSISGYHRVRAQFASASSGPLSLDLVATPNPDNRPPIAIARGLPPVGKHEFRIGSTVQPGEYALVLSDDLTGAKDFKMFTLTGELFAERMANLELTLKAIISCTRSRLASPSTLATR